MSAPVTWHGLSMTFYEIALARHQGSERNSIFSGAPFCLYLSPRYNCLLHIWRTLSGFQKCLAKKLGGIQLDHLLISCPQGFRILITRGGFRPMATRATALGVIYMSSLHHMSS